MESTESCLRVTVEDANFDIPLQLIEERAPGSVLAAMSSGNWRESNQERVPLRQVLAEPFGAIVDFLTTGALDAKNYVESEDIQRGYSAMGTPTNVLKVEQLLRTVMYLQIVELAPKQLTEIEQPEDGLTARVLQRWYERHCCGLDLAGANLALKSFKRAPPNPDFGSQVCQQNDNPRDFFCGQDIAAALFMGADLRGQSLCGTQAKAANFSLGMRYANFSDANLEDCKFIGTTFFPAFFPARHSSHSSMSSRNTFIFGGANIAGADFLGSRFGSHTE